MFLKLNHLAKTPPLEKILLGALSVWCVTPGVFIAERPVF